MNEKYPATIYGMVGCLSVASSKGGLISYEADLNLLKTHACSNLIFEISEPQEIKCQLTKKTEGAFIFKSIEIMEIRLGLNTSQSYKVKTHEEYGSMAEPRDIQAQYPVGEYHSPSSDVVSDELKRQNENLKRELDMVYQSRSWRLAKWLSKWYWIMHRLLGL